MLSISSWLHRSALFSVEGTTRGHMRVKNHGAILQAVTTPGLPPQDPQVGKSLHRLEPQMWVVFPSLPHFSPQTLSGSGPGLGYWGPGRPWSPNHSSLVQGEAPDPISPLPGSLILGEQVSPWWKMFQLDGEISHVRQENSFQTSAPTVPRPSDILTPLCPLSLGISELFPFELGFCPSSPLPRWPSVGGDAKVVFLRV